MTIDYTKLPFHWTGDAWILPDEERRANTLDDYWDEPPRPELPPVVMRHAFFVGSGAWYWDNDHKDYRVLYTPDGGLTLDGRALLDRLTRRAYCT